MKTRNNKIIEFDHESDIYIRKNITGIADKCLLPYTPYRITVHRDNHVYCVKGNCLIEKQTKKLVFTGLNFTIPDGVEVVGIHAFARWDDYSEMSDVIDLPPSVKYICPEAFYMAYARRVTLREGLKAIGARAFAYSTIRRVHIPATVKHIGRNPFLKCGKLNSVTSDSQNYFAENGCLIERKTMTLIAVCANRRVVIPDGVKIIADGVFWAEVNHDEVYIPASVHKIHGHNFYDCYRRIYSKADETDYYDEDVTVIVNKNTYAEYFARKHNLEYRIRDN